MRLLLALAALVLSGATAAAQHQHGKPGSTPEAFTATPAFGPDGALWVVRPTGDRIVVQRSTDLGKTFAAPPREPEPSTTNDRRRASRSIQRADRHLRFPGQD
jgi:hypothetical protein